MWSRLSNEFHFHYTRVNQQGIYKPGEFSVHSVMKKTTVDQADMMKGRAGIPWNLDKLVFRINTEDVLDIQPAALKLRLLLRSEDGNGFDETILLCTIPAFACSAFAGLPHPMIMYAANPATAQVPFGQQTAWLQLFASFAADPKKQLIVSNAYAQAQYEYELGVSLPAIRVHGLYSGAQHNPPAGSKIVSDILVYDRTSPLMAYALEALRQAMSTTATGLTPHFVHHAETDREYQTFASFAAVVFVPGDVEQMAFYEFYSMGLPVFVPSDAGRYMWPHLPAPKGPATDTFCNYAEWVGGWDLRFQDGSLVTWTIDCEGRVEKHGTILGSLQPLDLMDEYGFTHYLQKKGRPFTRLRVQREHLQVGMDAVLVEASRQAGSEQPRLPILWDHDIFASNAWYLEARIPGPQRASHSPFNISNHAAAHEWASVIDYFRFPAVGHFVSAAELLATFAANNSQDLLRSASRKMREFNNDELLRSTQQWEAVLSAVVA